MTLLAALASYTVLGQWILYFDINPLELGTSLLTYGLLDLVLCAVRKRRLEIPLSGLIIGLNIGLILDSYDLRIFAGNRLLGPFLRSGAKAGPVS